MDKVGCWACQNCHPYYFNSAVYVRILTSRCFTSAVVQVDLYSRLFQCDTSWCRWINVVDFNVRPVQVDQRKRRVVQQQHTSDGHHVTTRIHVNRIYKKATDFGEIRFWFWRTTIFEFGDTSTRYLQLHSDRGSLSWTAYRQWHRDLWICFCWLRSCLFSWRWRLVSIVHAAQAERCWTKFF